MKTILSKINLGALALILLVASATSCKKDKQPSLREGIVGEWVIKSFTLDGVEVKGSIVTSAKIEFEEYTGSNGDFEWDINYADGTSEHVYGDYTVDEEDKEIKFEDQNGEDLKLEFELDGDKLELSGISETGERLVMKSERD